MDVAASERERRGRIMKSRRVSCTLPAVVAMALVSAGCATTQHPAQRAATTTVTTTTKPPVTTTTPRPTTTTRTPSSTTTTAQPTAVGICLDTTTNTRVADSQCDTSDIRYSRFWYQHTDTFLYPAVGAAVVLAAGSFLRPTGGTVYERGAPVDGGSITRGGLGSSRPDTGGSGGS
ncbi:hypothetical protein [Nocardia sp. NPDC004415]